MMVQPLDALLEPVDRVRPGAEVPALLPTVDTVAMPGEPLAERESGLIAA
jgi:hypothetical protein